MASQSLTSTESESSRFCIARASVAVFLAFLVPDAPAFHLLQ